MPTRLHMLQGERQVRGGGIYPTASLVNHECLPNLARFDCFDAVAGGAPGDNTGIMLRALHAIPQGPGVEGGARMGAFVPCTTEGMLCYMTLLALGMASRQLLTADCLEDYQLRCQPFAPTFCCPCRCRRGADAELLPPALALQGAPAVVPGDVRL